MTLSSRKIHANGVQVASDSGAAFNGTAGDSIIGSQFGSGQYFPGVIDDVNDIRIYAQASELITPIVPD
ncbi:hypothetical protein ACFL6U_16860 [Planctomycetota bacterium]